MSKKRCTHFEPRVRTHERGNKHGRPAIYCNNVAYLSFLSAD